MTTLNNLSISSPTLTVNGNSGSIYARITADDIVNTTLGIMSTSSVASTATQRTIDSVTGYYSLVANRTSYPFSTISPHIMNPELGHETKEKLDKGTVIAYFEKLCEISTGTTPQTQAELKAILVMLKYHNIFEWRDENEQG